MIGCGNMGEAIVKGLAKERSGFGRIIVAEADTKKAAALKKKYSVSLSAIIDLVRESDIVVIAVKPQNIDEVLHEIKLAFSSGSRKIIIVSIAAGITTAYIENKLAKKVSVVRAMPNMAGQIGKGISALAAGRYAARGELIQVGKIFDAIGETVFVKEAHMDAVTAVSGSGPAYVFYFIQALVEAAVKNGIDRAIARKLVFQTLLGSVLMAEATQEDLDVLIKKVSSKGGTTEAAFRLLYKRKFKEIVVQAVSRARARARELARK